MKPAASNMEPEATPQVPTDPTRPALVRYVAASLVFIIAIAALGSYISVTFFRQARANIQVDLAAVAAFKTNQLVEWTGFMRGYLSQQPDSPLPTIWARWLAAGAPEGADQDWLRERLAFMQSQVHEIGEIHLFDTAGRLHLGTNPQGHPPLDVTSRAVIEQVINTRQPALLDFHPHPHNGKSQAVLGFVVPLLAHAAGEVRVVGILIGEIDPLQHFYPMVQSWPLASNTTEAVLFRVDGDKIVYLSPLLHSVSPPLSLHRSLDDPKLLAAKAMRQGTGVVDGVDYDDEPAIGVVSRVTGTDWFLLTKMDYPEMFQEAWLNTQRLALALATLAAAVLLVIRLLWRKAMVQTELELVQFTQRLDLAQRKQVEASAALDRSEAMFRTYFNRAMVGMATTSPAKQWIEVNPALCRILGYSREQLLTKTWTELTHPEDLASSVARFERVLSGRSTVMCWNSVSFVRTAASSMPTSLPRRCDEPTSRDFFVAFIEDISARKRSERALAESERRLKLALEAANEAMWDWDVHTDIVIVSLAYYRMLGEEPDGQPLSFAQWYEKMHPADRQTIGEALREAVAQGRERIEFEYRMRTQIGGWCWIHSYGKTVERDAEGRTSRMIGINLDDTARRQAVEHRQREADRTSGMLMLSEIENDLEEPIILRFGLELAEKLTDSQFAFLYFIDDDQQTLDLAIWSGHADRMVSANAHDSKHLGTQDGF